MSYVSPYVQAPPPALGVLPQALVDDSEELHQSTVLAQVILKDTHTSTHSCLVNIQSHTQALFPLQ